MFGFHHRLASKLDNLFSVSILMNFIISAFTICFMGFVVTYSIEISERITFCLILIVNVAQLCLLCSKCEQFLNAVSKSAIISL